MLDLWVLGFKMSSSATCCHACKSALAAATLQHALCHKCLRIRIARLTFVTPWGPACHLSTCQSPLQASVGYCGVVVRATKAVRLRQVSHASVKSVRPSQSHKVATACTFRTRQACLQQSLEHRGLGVIAEAAVRLRQASQASL